MHIDRTSKHAAFLVNLAYVVAVTALVVLFFRYAVGWLMPFIIGLAIAMAFAPLIRVTAKRLKIDRRIVACVVVVFGYAILITFVSVCTIQLISFLGGLFAQLPSFFETQVLPMMNDTGTFFAGYINDLPDQWQIVIENIQASVMGSLQNAITSISSGGVSFVAGFMRALPAFLVAMVFTILASFFITMDYDHTVKFLMAQLSERAREIATAAKDALKGTVFKWFKAYFILMMITFAELAIGLSILRFENSVLIAAGIALFDFLPVFGTGGVVIPWIVIIFASGDTAKGVGLLILYGIMTVIRNFIEPKIVGDQLGLHPIVSLISIYLGFVWFGVMGMIFMPIAVQIALSLHNQGVIKLYKRPE